MPSEKSRAIVCCSGEGGGEIHGSSGPFSPPPPKDCRVLLRRPLHSVVYSQRIFEPNSRYFLFRFRGRQRLRLFSACPGHADKVARTKVSFVFAARPPSIWMYQ